MTTLDGAVDLARDRDLVERCQGGDDAAFAELYDRYRRRLYRYCLRRVHVSEDAEEAVQESFTRAWRALPRFAGERRFYPWLTVIAGNVCTDMLRRRQRVVPMDEMPGRALELGGADVDVDDQILREADLALATEALGHLSDRHQRVLRLRESTEWSAQRIAEVEGLAVPAVDTLLWRARQAFKREFTALSEAGGFAAVLGVVTSALRRSALRAASRLASWTPGPVRSPGAFAASVAITGAAIAGGTAAIVGTTTGHPPPAHAAASRATTPAPARSQAASTASGSDLAGSGRSAGARAVLATRANETRSTHTRVSTPTFLAGAGATGGFGTALRVVPSIGGLGSSATPLHAVLRGVDSLAVPGTATGGGTAASGATSLVGHAVNEVTRAVSGLVAESGTLTALTGALASSPTSGTPSGTSASSPTSGTAEGTVSSPVPSAVTSLLGAARSTVTSAAGGAARALSPSNG